MILLNVVFLIKHIEGTEEVIDLQKFHLDGRF